MAQFTDNAERTWQVALNVDAITQVREATDFDLLLFFAGDTPTEQTILRLQRDPVLLVNVLYLVCKEQADALGVSDRDFGRAMAGDAIAHGTEALLEAVVNFTPNPKDRERLRKARGMVEVWTEKANEVLDRELETALPKELDLALTKFTRSFGSGLGSLASTQGDSHSAN